MQHRRCVTAGSRMGSCAAHEMTKTIRTHGAMAGKIGAQERLADIEDFDYSKESAGLVPGVSRASDERLRVGRDVWAVLTRGLGVLTRHQNIRSLELSFVTMKHMTGKFTELSSETDEIENSCIEPSRSASLLEVFGPY